MITSTDAEKTFDKTLFVIKKKKKKPPNKMCIEGNKLT